jgi:hypothetical protein
MTGATHELIQNALLGRYRLRFVHHHILRSISIDASALQSAAQGFDTYEIDETGLDLGLFCGNALDEAGA